MTRDQWATVILNRIGQRGGAASPVDAVLLQQVKDEFQVQQEELEKAEMGTMPWFLEQEYTNASFKTTNGSATIAVPSGFLREWDEVKCTLFYQDTTQSDQWVPIKKADYDELKVMLGDANPGKPLGYCMVGTNYRVFPTPDAAYNLKALIYVADTPLTSDGQNNWLTYAPRVLVGKVGETIARFNIRDEDAAAFFADMHAQGAAGLLRDNVARKEAGRSRSMGDE